MRGIFENLCGIVRGLCRIASGLCDVVSDLCLILSGPCCVFSLWRCIRRVAHWTCDRCVRYASLADIIQFIVRDLRAHTLPEILFVVFVHSTLLQL